MTSSFLRVIEQVRAEVTSNAQTSASALAGHLGRLGSIADHAASETAPETAEAERELAAWVDGDPNFERVASAPFSVVCFRYKGTDDENRALLEKVNASGQTFISHTELNGRYVLRIAIGNLATTREDVQAVWELIRASA